MKSMLSLSSVAALLAAVLLSSCCGPAAREESVSCAVPPRAEGQTDVLGLRCPALDTVRVAFIGLGNRGKEAVKRFTHLEGVRVVALCDLVKEYVDRSQETLVKAGLPAAAGYYASDKDWKKVCERPDVDLVYICTDWSTHTPMAVYAMRQGKHVAVEVPAALTVEECWQLVDAAEQTRRHCMMLENCCYDFFEMTTLNMAQKGLFGEIVHVEGAYIHDLRNNNFSPDFYHDMWRLKYNAAHTGNPYPTHGLGPVCQILNIHRGDRMEYLVSLSSDQFGLSEEAVRRFGAGSPQAEEEYRLGDMNTTLIRTARGKTIMIQHDVTSPRPYSRLHTVSGTRGFAQKYPVQGIALPPDTHRFLPAEQLRDTLAKYEHPITREVGEQARRVGGHGGMDFIMDYRLVYCLRNGLPLDQDVYDAAEWSVLVPLTEESVRRGGQPVPVPDFTRGAWDKLKGLKLAE